MELHFQKQQIQQKDCILDRNTVTTATSNGNKKRKFVGVRQRPSGKWVAEIKNTTQKIRMWLGTFDTAEEAAQAYDEAACLLRGSNTRTNFINNPHHHHNHHHCNPALSLKIRNLLNQKRNRNKMTSTTPTPPVASTKKCNDSSSSTSIISSVTQENSFAATNYNYNQISNQDQDQKIKLFDDAYKPDLSYFMGGFEMGSSSSSSSSPHLQNHQIFDDRILVGEEQQEQEQEKGFDEISTRESELINNETHHQIQDFEHMKVERQISASLYAMNGVNEYWENVHDCNDSFWDLPMLYQMFCPS